MVFKGRVLKGFFFGLFALFILFPAMPGSYHAFALSDSPQQWFDQFTAGNPVTNAASNPVINNWTLSYTGGQTYNLSVTQFNSSAGGPVTSDGLISYAPITSTEPPYEYAEISSPAFSGCSPCAVTLTYKDPSNLVASGQYIMVDVLTLTSPKQFQLVVTGTDGTTIVSSSSDILNNCLNPPATIAQNTINDQWATVFISNTLSVPVSTVSLIIPNGSAGDLDQNDGDFVYVDDLFDNDKLSCLVPPTPTFTMTATPSSTFTDTPTVTPTPTVTLSPTPTSSPTVTPTHTQTSTPSSTPTVTSTFTQTSTPTPTVSPTPTSSPTVTPTITATSTLTSTLTATGTPTPTNSPPPPFTATNTGTSTPSPTPANTGTPSYTPTPSNTPSPTSSPTPSWTLTPSFSPTPSLTPTVTTTPTITNTPLPTATYTNTPCPVDVYPNPMDFQHNPAFNNNCPSSSPCIKFSCIPPTSTLSIYTVSLALVRTFGPNYDSNYVFIPSTGTGLITWDGNNGDGNPVASGFYLYKIEGPNGRTFGKFAISRSSNGP